MDEQTWYVVIPFNTRESAEHVAQQVMDTLGYGACLAAATEDDPPLLPGIPFTGVSTS